eukprot:scpid78993/ scgid20536/ 
MPDPNDPKDASAEPLSDQERFRAEIQALRANYGALFRSGVRQLSAAEHARKETERNEQRLANLHALVVEVTEDESRPVMCGNNPISASDLVNILDEEVVPRLKAQGEPGKVKLRVRNYHAISLEHVIRALHKVMKYCMSNICYMEIGSSELTNALLVKLISDLRSTSENLMSNMTFHLQNATSLTSDCLQALTIDTRSFAELFQELIFANVPCIADLTTLHFLFSPGLKESKLQCLTITDVDLKDEALSYLGMCIGSPSSQLKKVKLNRVTNSVKGIKEMLMQIAQPGCALQCLDIGNNLGLTDAVALRLHTLFQLNKLLFLKELHVGGWSAMTPVGTALLVRCMQFRHNVEVLTLPSSSIKENLGDDQPVACVTAMDTLAKLILNRAERDPCNGALNLRKLVADFRHNPETRSTAMIVTAMMIRMPEFALVPANPNRANRVRVPLTISAAPAPAPAPQ